ncbi:hypothetical protein CPB85DRAFT_797278 [Mucidula mucida]|nr:hypothetical protein CPB85DRAFT_797278 [Mucidula mucida]
MSLSSQSYVFFPHSEGILPTTAKRYWKGTAAEGGITLVCAHCTTSHKEAYEPFIEDLYEALPTGFIREVWAVEHPNHGEAAVINEATLLAVPYSQQCELILAAGGLIIERFM